MSAPTESASSARDTAEFKRRNPYRGPKEFGRGDRLPNRESEAREVADLVIASRAVLLHAPSGAGKTSLVEAGVVRELAEEGFRATPRLRVNQPPSGEGSNRYIESLVSYLFAMSTYEKPPPGISLEEAVGLWTTQHAEDDERAVLVLDQFEELLILDPTDWPVKEMFFRELGDILRSQPVWALLSMREDYIGGLDRYRRYLPGLLASSYRLDFLTREDARLAIQVPAEQQRVDFTDDAAEALVSKLATVRVEEPDKVEIKDAPYVEPFQLQVACRQLWKKVRKQRGDNFPTITVTDVEEHADIDQALTAYYGDTVASVVQQTGADERTMREWFETELITKKGYRSQTQNPPDTVQKMEVIRLLEDGYLIRGDVRGLTTWYELTHDRLIGPIGVSNESWRWENLEPWQIAAYEWGRNDHFAGFLLDRLMPGPNVRRTQDLTDVEIAFLAESEKEHARQGVLARARGWLRSLLVVVIFEAVAIVFLLLYIKFR